MPGVLFEPDDVCLYVTEKCNSNCIMCPMSLHSRQRGLSLGDDEWNNILGFLPEHTKHITITGGEPFLVYDRIIPVMKEISTRCPEAEILVLTNGRALAVDRVFEQLKSSITEKFRFAIPLHASTEELHDRITQSPGSFQQTILGIKRLKETKAKIEIRIVGHRLNLHDISELFTMIALTDIKPDIINLIAMEMTGCAGRNRDELWVDYNLLAENARRGIQYVSDFLTCHSVAAARWQ